MIPNPTSLTNTMIKLWEMIVDYKDKNGRQISSIFMVLPTRKELPNYYQIIKKPIDLKKIKVISTVLCTYGYGTSIDVITAIVIVVIKGNMIVLRSPQWV